MRKGILVAVAISVPLGLLANTSEAQTLSPDASRDLARVFAPSPGQAARFNNLLSLDSIRLTDDLAKAGVARNPTCILPNVGNSANPATTPRDVFSEWHCLLLNILAIDHIPEFNQSGVNLHYQQFGPHRASYAAAMTHLAMYEVANAFGSAAHQHKSWITQQWQSVGLTLSPPANASEAAAIAAAANRMLIYLYPHLNDVQEKQTYGVLSDNYSQSINAIKSAPGSGDVQKGTQFGETIANIIIAIRAHDNADLAEIQWNTEKGFVPQKSPLDAFQWTMDPVSKITVALGANWGKVTPFIVAAPETFPFAAPPTQLSDPTFKNNFDEVKTMGVDPWHPDPNKHSQQTKEQYFEGKFWSYDGTAGICAPVRLYNQIADTILVQYYAKVAAGAPPLAQPDPNGNSNKDAAADIAHYYALLSVAMADAGIVAWHYKYKYQYWRPVTGIRYVAANAPGGSGNLQTEMLHWQPAWYPLGAQNTNAEAGYNITPPFPAYPSGHSVFGSAFFGVLKSLLKEDAANPVKFDFQSDELNGEQRLGNNVDAYNFVRCQAPPAGQTSSVDYDPTYCDVTKTTKWHFKSLADAEQRNSDSRVWLGVHWRNDSEKGMQLGKAIGNAVLAQAFK